jgi:hypothetical protein
MIEKDYSEEFEYLNELRESGETNMFGAGRYLQNDFGLNKYEARDIVLAWMKSFNKENV